MRASSSGRARRESTTANGPCVMTTRSPIRGRFSGFDRPEPPLGHGLLPRRDPGALPQHLGPRRPDVVGGTGLGPHLRGPELGRDVSRPGGQARVVGDVDPLVQRHVDHPVVGGDGQRAVTREGGREPGELAVDRLELVAPLPGVAAEDVPGLVELAPVEVDEGARRRPHGGERGVDPGGQAVGGREAPTAERGVGQARSRRSTRGRRGSPAPRTGAPARRRSRAAASAAGRVRPPTTAR